MLMRRRLLFSSILCLTCLGAQHTRAQDDSATKNEMPQWILVRSRNIDFYFQDTIRLPISARRYMSRHEEAYQILSEIFEPKLPCRLTYYVWTDGVLARRILGSPLGFANPTKCLCNVHPRQTLGHEMTHVLSYWAWGIPPRKRTRFVNEGLATAFDLNTRILGEGVGDSLKGADYKSIIELWEKDGHAKATILYPAAAAFVMHLRNNITPAEFQALIKEQTIKHTRRLLGKKRFKRLVEEFDRIAGLR